GRAAQIILGRSILLLTLGLLLVWFFLSRRFSWKRKGETFAVLVLLVATGFAAIRDVEQTGDNGYLFHCRWEKTQDERLAEYVTMPTPGMGTADPRSAGYGEFLGPRRDGVAPGPALALNWEVAPPRLRWVRPVGGGYASFVTAGGLAVTLEQRGEEE